MNNGLKNILVFGVGAILGGVSTYFVTKERIKATYEEVIEEEISSMREHFRKKKEKIMEEVNDLDGEVSATDLKEKKVKENQKAEKKTKRDYQKNVKRLGYSNLDENGNAEGDVNGSDGVEDNSNSDEEDLAYKYEQLSKQANKKLDEGAYVITEEQFNEECDHFAKETIYYYEDDDVLADEGEQVITEVRSTIGDDALDHFGYGTSDPEVVYVRNEEYQIDYEVIRYSKSYAETVLGYEDKGR